MDPALAARFARQKDFTGEVRQADDQCGCRSFHRQEKLERGDEDVVEIGSQANQKKQLDPVLAQRWVAPASSVVGVEGAVAPVRYGPHARRSCKQERSWSTMTLVRLQQHGFSQG
eukprot:Skav222937  [mRNA]  locus=scaffold1489:472924:473268:- [translate_table: standard]